MADVCKACGYDGIRTQGNWNVREYAFRADTGRCRRCEVHPDAVLAEQRTAELIAAWHRREASRLARLGADAHPSSIAATNYHTRALEHHNAAFRIERGDWKEGHDDG